MNKPYHPADNPRTALSAQIDSLLRARGSLTATELASATGKSQQSISLAISALGEEVCRIGAARSTRYALTKPIYGLPATQPLVFTDEQGTATRFGDLTQLDDGSIHVRSHQGKEWLGPPNELPWFLAPLRPQGFLARAMRGVRPDFPEDPENWDVGQALFLAIAHHRDPPGAFSVGALSAYLSDQSPRRADTASEYYDQLAINIGKTLPAGSSAGGEQPKFVTTFEGGAGEWHHVIVKFSPPRGTPFGERWHALLHLEHLASRLLGKYGVAVAAINIVETPARTYLESARFDRVGHQGKRHVVAIDAIDRKFNSLRRENWITSAEGLHQNKLVTHDERSTIAKIFAFGQFIGNTDMHFGNLSFFVDDVVKPRIRLAPLYDMLPMMWRPSIHSGGLDATPSRPQAPVPGYAQEYAEAREWAIEYWHRAADLPALSEDLRRACVESEKRLKQ